MLVTNESMESMMDANFLPVTKVEDGGERTSPSDVMLHHEANRSGKGSSSKPFFIMDWLEQVDPKAIERAQKILLKSKKQAPLDSLKKDLFDGPFVQKSISIGNGYNSKGLHKARQGDYVGALKCFEDALAVRTQIYGDTHIDVANSYNNIGIALLKLNRLDEAVGNLQKALEIRRKTENLTEVAATLHNLGNVFQQQGNFATAIQYFLESRDLQEDTLGNHIEVARACVAIGHTYYQAELFQDARLAYMDALRIFHKVNLTIDEPEVQHCLMDIQELDDRLSADD